MQIRQPSLSLSSSKKKKSPWLTVIPIGIALSIMVFSSWFQKGSPTSTTSDDGDKAVMIRDTPSSSISLDRGSKPEIVYSSVSTGNSDILRYAAYTLGLDGTQQPLSIARWAESIAHDDETYATELAMNLTKIVKVRSDVAVCD
jgi:hypothetical protein